MKLNSETIKIDKSSGKAKYYNIIIYFCSIALLALIAPGCSSQIEGTGSQQSVSSAVTHANAGIATDCVTMYFTRYRGAAGNIITRAIDGTLETALTSDSYDNRCVRGCSFGGDLLYSSNKSGTFRVYKISFGGTSPVDLLRSAGSDFLDAAYSKDGKFIVFTAIDRSDANRSHICMVDSAGENFQILTSSESLKRKPTVSAGNSIVMFQKKVDGYWGLYYVDLKAADKVEKEFFAEPSLDSFDPEFLASNAQTSPGAEEVIFMHGKIGSSVRMIRALFSNKVYSIVKNFSGYYYFSQPAVSNDGKTVLFIQRPLGGGRDDVWKTTLYAGTPYNLTD